MYHTYYSRKCATESTMIVYSHQWLFQGVSILSIIYHTYYVFVWFKIIFVMEGEYITLVPFLICFYLQLRPIGLGGFISESYLYCWVEFCCLLGCIGKWNIKGHYWSNLNKLLQYKWKRCKQQFPDGPSTQFLRFFCTQHKVTSFDIFSGVTEKFYMKIDTCPLSAFDTKLAQELRGSLCSCE